MQFQQVLFPPVTICSALCRTSILNVSVIICLPSHLLILTIVLCNSNYQGYLNNQFSAFKKQLRKSGYHFKKNLKHNFLSFYRFFFSFFLHQLDVISKRGFDLEDLARQLMIPIWKTKFAIVSSNIYNLKAEVKFNRLKKAYKLSFSFAGITFLNTTIGRLVVQLTGLCSPTSLCSW